MTFRLQLAELDGLEGFAVPFKSHRDHCRPIAVAHEAGHGFCRGNFLTLT